MRFSVPLLAAALLLTTNCKKGADGGEAIAKHRAAVEEVLANADKVLAKARKDPPAASDDGLPEDAPAVGSDEVATEQIESLEQLEDESAKGRKMDLPSADYLVGCAKILRTKDTSSSAAFDIERCAKAKYVLVVRIRDHRAPEKGSGKSFTPGEASGDALLYRLKGAKKIGAFAFSATNSEKIGVLKSDIADAELRKDLANAVTRALTASGKSEKKTTTKKKASDDDE